MPSHQEDRACLVKRSIDSSITVHLLRRTVQRCIMSTPGDVPFATDFSFEELLHENRNLCNHDKSVVLNPLQWPKAPATPHVISPTTSEIVPTLLWLESVPHPEPVQNDQSSQDVVDTGKKHRKLCSADGCLKFARSAGLCSSHGGRRWCSANGCNKVAQVAGLCSRHGGTKPVCLVSGCAKATQSHGLCKMHGGGSRCTVSGCLKGAISQGKCRQHGGGQKCLLCTKWAQRRGYCIRHYNNIMGTSSNSVEIELDDIFEV
jgi:hypothetical protein